MRFEVTIVYREPTYAVNRGIPLVDYRGVFVVRAASEEQARATALARFQEAVSRETVGWVREVQRVECRQVESGQPEVAKARWRDTK